MTIWGILFTILKTIGIILLILLLLILLVLLLVLFVPIRYRVRADKNGWDMNAGANVTWLLHMLAVDVAFSLRENGDRKITKDIRIFGVSIFRIKDWLSKRKRKKPRSDTQVVSEADDSGSLEKNAVSKEAPPGSTSEAEETSPVDEVSKAEDLKEETSADVHEAPIEAAVHETPIEDGPDANSEPQAGQETAAVSADNGPRRSYLRSLIDLLFGIIQKAAGLILAVPGGIMNLALALFMKIIRFFIILCSSPGMIVDVLGSAIDKALTIWGKITLISDFFFDDRTQDAIHLVFAQLGHLIGHVRPRTLSGYLDFGFTDPSITGRVLGGLSIFLPQCGKTFDINPDFENPHLDCDINSRGRIILFYPVFIVVRTILDKNIKYVYRYFKHVRKELSQA